MEKDRKKLSPARAVRARKRHQKRVYKQNKTGVLCAAGILSVLLIAVSIRIFTMYQSNHDLKVEEIAKAAELEAEQERQKEIEEYARYVHSPEYIEQLAKSKLGLLYPNEIVFKEEKEEP